MRFDVLTLFPEIFAGYLGQGLLKRAIERGLVEVRMHNIRDWTDDKHHTVDDRPFGGGPGMVLKVEPVDPRELLRGDYVRLGYDISRLPGSIFVPPPASTQSSYEERPVWVLLKPGCPAG